jgi:hypothetical protein
MRTLNVIMAIQPVQYENLLATCSDFAGAIALLKQYRPYLEAIPSMRRPQDSVITIPLPAIRVRQPLPPQGQTGMVVEANESVLLPCDVVLLMCDPEWKIKTGVEICVFIHRPQEDFSDLLMRWRRTQIMLDRGYEWLLPARHQHLLSDGADVIRPLFVLFPGSPERISKGLKGAGLPIVTYADETRLDDAAAIASPILNDNELLDIKAAEEFDLADLDDIGNAETSSE